MSADDKQRISQYFSAFNHADWEGMLSALTDDVRLEINGGQAIVGQKAFTEHLSENKMHFLEVFSDVHIVAGSSPGEYAVDYVLSGQYLSSAPGLPPARGQHYRLGGQANFAMRDGAIARIRMTLDEDGRRAQLADD